MTLLGCTVTLQGHGEWGPPTARADQLCVALASRTTHTVPRSAAPASASPACTRIAQLSFVPRPFWSGPWGKTCGWPSLAGGAGPQKRPLLHPPPATCPEASALPDSWRVPPPHASGWNPRLRGRGVGRRWKAKARAEAGCAGTGGGRGLHSGRRLMEWELGVGSEHGMWTHSPGGTAVYFDLPGSCCEGLIWGPHPGSTSFLCCWAGEADTAGYSPTSCPSHLNCRPCSKAQGKMPAPLHTLSVLRHLAPPQLRPGLHTQSWGGLVLSLPSPHSALPQDLKGWHRWETGAEAAVQAPHSAITIPSSLLGPGPALLPQPCT